MIRILEEPVDPIPGNDVHLTIDTRLQSVAQEALLSQMDDWNFYKGYTTVKQWCRHCSRSFDR